MNYRHAYHAGNHGDVLKHIVLARVLNYLTAKEKPFAVLDAHAGIGVYDLGSVEAAKTLEWQEGIGKLAGAAVPSDMRGLLAPYLDVFAAINPGGAPQHYPGSPEIVMRLTRLIDRLILNELHAQDRETLRQRYNVFLRVRVTGVDALQAVKAELPFAEKRGLVLIDPAFEVQDETARVVEMVAQGLRRMAHAVFMIWYPVTSQDFADEFCAAVASCGVSGILHAELLVREPFAEGGLAGSGMIVINPPWLLHDELQIVLPYLARLLGKGHWGRGSVNWLTPPS